MKLASAVALVLAVAAGIPAPAQDQPADNMDILADKVKADKKLVVADNMGLTESEAKAFWPVYDAYQKELQQINDRLYAVILAYAEAYKKGPVTDAAAKKLGEPVAEPDLRDHAKASTLASRLGIDIDSKWGTGKITTTIFETLVEASLVQPTFVYDFPTEVSPLSKQRPDDPDTVERFELYIANMEVANAFSELNDPLEQRRRFEQQLEERAKGDQEAHAMDEDYVRALEYGMPPTGGVGIGVDRLVMLLADQPSIRDVILFPAMRPEA